MKVEVIWQVGEILLLSRGRLCTKSWIARRE